MRRWHPGWTLLAGLAGYAIGLPQAASAACAGRIRSADLAPSLAYDGFSPSATVALKDVRIENTGSDDCSYWLAFHRDPEAPALLGGRIAYELRTASGVPLLTDRPPTVVPDRFLSTGRVRAGSADRVEYQWTILRGQVAPAGAYGDGIDLRLFEAGSNALLDSRTLALSATVDARVSINLAGADVGSPYRHTMDFGVLEAGEAKSVHVQVRSNHRFRLDVASTNRGRMQLAPPFQQWAVDYGATLDGRALRFPDSLGPYEATAVAGVSLLLRVTIGDVADKRAGVYRDELTITIVPAT